jgi:hypothetical protein
MVGNVQEWIDAPARGGKRMTLGTAYTAGLEVSPARRMWDDPAVPSEVVGVRFACSP